MEVKSAATFAKGIRDAVRGLWLGVFDYLAFVDSMTSTIWRGYESAWAEGAAQCGMSPADRTRAEQGRLDQIVNTDLGYVPSLADFITQNSKENEGKLGKSLARAEMWANRYNYVVGVAQQMSCADQKYMWVVGPTDHCGDCARYDGRIYRGTVWAAVGASPQSRSLACRGYRCQCSLVLVTSAAVRAWPGRPPRPTGG